MDKKRKFMGNMWGKEKGLRADPLYTKKDKLKVGNLWRRKK